MVEISRESLEVLFSLARQAPIQGAAGDLFSAAERLAQVFGEAEAALYPSDAEAKEGE